MNQLRYFKFLISLSKLITDNNLTFNNDKLFI